MKLKKIIAVMAVAGVTLPGVAMATNGMFADGYGMTAAGMGGAATAMSEDTFGGANNPASMVFVGDRLDLGASLFSPHRQATSGFAGAVGGQANEDSDSNYFVVPEFGYNKMINANVSLGVSLYGNGGMNTNYAGGTVPAGVCQTPTGRSTTSNNMLCGNGNLGINLEQLILAPTVAFKINDRNSIGISPLLGYQRFMAQGLQGFEGFSSNPNNMTNNGYDDAYGTGVRVGYMGIISPQLTFGAAYSSKVTFGTMSKYAGLFAGQGSLDLPENYNVGLAYKATPALTIALDYQRINYAGVAAIGNSSSNSLNFTGTNQLGSNGGSGFGWQDINVWKLGGEYKYNDNWTLRAGWNHGDNPITPADVTFNIIAPGVITDHLTMGASYANANGGVLTVAYTHGFENSVTGPDKLLQLNGMSGSDTIRMYQDIVGVAYAWKM